MSKIKISRELGNELTSVRSIADIMETHCSDILWNKDNADYDTKFPFKMLTSLHDKMSKKIANALYDIPKGMGESPEKTALTKLLNDYLTMTGKKANEGKAPGAPDPRFSLCEELLPVLKEIRTTINDTLHKTVPVKNDMER